MRCAAMLLCLLLLPVACKERPADSVQKYGDVMMQSYEKGKEAGKLANLEVLRNAVRTHYAAEGRYPQSVDDLKRLAAPDIDISQYEYDPQSGIVTLKE